MVVDSLRLPHVCLRNRRTWEFQPPGRKPAPRGPRFPSGTNTSILSLAFCNSCGSFFRPPNQFACSPRRLSCVAAFLIFPPFHGPTFLYKKHPGKTKSVAANYFGFISDPEGFTLVLLFGTNFPVCFFPDMQCDCIRIWCRRHRSVFYLPLFLQSLTCARGGGGGCRVG